jgi:hypothetical protein
VKVPSSSETITGRPGANLREECRSKAEKLQQANLIVTAEAMVALETNLETLSPKTRKMD